jgi:3-phosphoshikimate 1-carboxyvinyltransferase
VLLAGLGTDEPVEVAEPVPEPRSYGDHAGRVRGRGGTERAGDAARRKRSLEARLVEVGGDPSSAAFALGAAAIVPGSEVTVTGMLLNPHRSGFVMALQRMGADLAMANIRGRSGETIGDVRVRFGPLFGAEFTAEEIPSMVDEIPMLAVVAAGARGETRIEGLDELRHKESDRLALMAEGLTACGVEVRAEGDALVVRGGPVRGGAGRTEGDHRIAMAHLCSGWARRSRSRWTRPR